MVDVNTQFGGFLTNLGAAKNTNANALGVKWKLTHMLIGDANGTDPAPSPGQTALVNLVYRAQLNQLYPSPVDANVLIAELVLPPDVGGWWIRELALEDEDGVFSAVAKCPPSYKPLLAQGSGRNQVVRMHVVTSGTANIQLKIDPSVVLATRAYCDGLIAAHAAAANPHPQYVTGAVLAAAIAAINFIPPNYIAGLTLANNAAAPATDIDISPGSASATGNNASLLLNAKLTKRLQAAGGWASGAGANGLFAGLRAANSWYHVFLIRRDNDGAIDAGFDTSVTAENRPAGYGEYRRIGSIKTDANGDVIGFRNIGRRFIWKAPIKDAVFLNRGLSGSEGVTISTPPGVRTLVDLHVASAGHAQFIYVRSPDSSAAVMAHVADNVAAWQVGVGANTANVDHLAFPATSDTGLASDVVLQWIAIDSAPDFSITTLAWEEI